MRTATMAHRTPLRQRAGGLLPAQSTKPPLCAGTSLTALRVSATKRRVIPETSLRQRAGFRSRRSRGRRCWSKLVSPSRRCADRAAHQRVAWRMACCPAACAPPALFPLLPASACSALRCIRCCLTAWTCLRRVPPPHAPCATPNPPQDALSRLETQLADNEASAEQASRLLARQVTQLAQAKAKLAMRLEREAAAAWSASLSEPRAARPGLLKQGGASAGPAAHSNKAWNPPPATTFVAQPSKCAVPLAGAQGIGLARTLPACGLSVHSSPSHPNAWSTSRGDNTYGWREGQTHASTPPAGSARALVGQLRNERAQQGLPPQPRRTAW